MKNHSIKLTALLLAIIACASLIQAQSTTQVLRSCPGVNPTRREAKVEVRRDGNINIIPCAGKNVLIADVSLTDIITGSNGTNSGGNGNSIITGSTGRSSYVPYFADDTTIQKSAIAYNSTLLRVFDTSDFYAAFDKSNKRFRVLDGTNASEFFDYNAGSSYLQVKTNDVAMGNLFGSSARFELSSTGGTITTRAASGWTHLNDFTVNGTLTANSVLMPPGTAGGTPGIKFQTYTGTGFGTDGSNLAIYANTFKEVNISANSFRVRSNTQFQWASTDDNYSAPDTGIIRVTPGLLKITDGVSGDGSLQIGTLYLKDGTFKQVEVGAANSGGTGYKLLRVAN